MTKMTSIGQPQGDTIRVSGKTGLTVKQMRKLISPSHSMISRLLSGNPDRVDDDDWPYKCLPLVFYDGSVSREKGGYQRACTHGDHMMSEIWSAGISRRLDESDKRNVDTDPGDDPDGVMHLCTPMHGLCTQECIDTESNCWSVLENTDEMLGSSFVMHTLVRAYRESECENNSLYAPEKNAYILSKSIIYPVYKKKRVYL